ncbi:MAG: exodeoxyribonuclease V subunit gamma [Chlamydiales bacterium]|nr:exodeoxyribonuclease V subunit gamma [Chlamydiales bacterium]
MSSLQKEILLLNTPVLEGEKDASIRVHGADSYMEEVEALYDRIQSSQLEPKEILVLTPDLTLYAPFIKAVFGKEGSLFSFSLEGIRYPKAL